MELEVSRRTLSAAGVLIALALLALLGHAVTPVTGRGERLVLSPSYVATMRYLRAAQERLDRLAAIDAALVAVMAGQGNIYTQGRDAERVFERAVAVARSVERDQVPAALGALHTALARCADEYVRAAQAALIWISAPSAEHRQAVDASLEQARGSLSETRALQEARWPTH